MLLSCAGIAAEPAPTPEKRIHPEEWLEQMIGTGQGERAWLARPDLRELWVPANRLKDILAKFPNAVVLSREQYEALVRDAALDKKPAPVAPRRAALTAAKYQARLAGKVVQVTAVLTVKVLADEWAQVPLDFGGASIGAVSVDGEAALMPGPGFRPMPVGQQAASIPYQPSPPELLLRGRGERKVTVEFTLPVVPEAGLSRLRAKLPSAAAGTFVFELPAGQRVESPQPISIKKTPEATSVTAALAPSNPVLELSWRGVGDAAQALAPLVRAEGSYTIDAEKVRAEFRFAVESQLGNAPTAFRIALPAEAKVLQVTGDELAKWEVADGRLAITLQPGERAAAKFVVVLETPSLAAAPRAELALPVPRLDGLARMQGAFSIVGDAGVTVGQIATDGSLEATDCAGAAPPHFVASYKFTTQPAGPRVTVEKVQPRFSADLDTLVEFKTDAIFLERTLTLHQEKGEVFSTAVTLPAGEEVLGVRGGDDTEPDWRMEAGKLRLRWGDAGEKSAARVFKIRTRIEPEKWTQLGADGIAFTLGDAQIDGAEKITGYIALKADGAFRLEAEASETLERRDGRTTPVQGDYAWFRRADFTLKVKVAKRPGEVLAALTGYALPLEGVLDLHAQMNFQFLYSGARSVRVRVPKALAANFYFDGPQIAERNRADDIWTIVFQKELTGGYALKITAQVPVAMGNDATEARFSVAIPVIAPLDVVRASGVWAVEANTETEITFDAKGLNELDSLLAPRLADYQPRHRVIGVFAWLGADYTLALSGVRHAPAAVLTSVVDQLTLETVVSTSGVERNQATFQIRTAGAQYLDVQLPEKSRLLSLTVDGELVKPVGDRADRVRVQLPAKRDANRALAVAVLYETPQTEWRSTGGYAPRAPQLAKDIPILRSQWRLYLPDGFEYMGVESNLRVEDRGADAPLVAALFDGLTSFVRVYAKTPAKAPRAQPTADSSDMEPADQPAPPSSSAQLLDLTGAVERKLERIILPRLEFKDATIREAVDYLRLKSVELDPDEPKTGVNIVLNVNRETLDSIAADPNLNSRITVSLTNVPLIEALRYVTGLAYLRFKVELDAVVICPPAMSSDVILARAWKIRPDLIPNLQLGVAEDRDTAKNWLMAHGVQFVTPESGAVFIPATSTLIVKNSQDQMVLIEETLTTGKNALQSMTSANFGVSSQQKFAGLLPMRIDLPKVGRVMVLEGLSAAERVEFRYDDWWSRARRLWVWFVGGGLLCWFIAQERPWWRTCWAVLALTFFPLVVTVSAMAVCNALLAGWLVSLVLQRVATRLVFAPGKREVVA